MLSYSMFTDAHTLFIVSILLFLIFIHLLISDQGSLENSNLVFFCRFCFSISSSITFWTCS